MTANKDKTYYAIGDIHGALGLLKVMVDFIEQDAKSMNSTPVFYFLGDIVDRGLHSMQCLEVISDVLKKYPDSRLHKGNHDIWFMEAIESQGRAQSTIDWLDHGGKATLASFGEFSSLKQASIDIKANYPDVLTLLQEAHDITIHGKIAFCHAGVNRARPIDSQDTETLTWIRGPFLRHIDRNCEVIVHGHTIFERGPFITENRISLDVGAYATGRLVAFKINPERRIMEFMEANTRDYPPSIDYIQPKFDDRGLGSVFDRAGEIYDNWQ